MRRSKRYIVQILFLFSLLTIQNSVAQSGFTLNKDRWEKERGNIDFEQEFEKKEEKKTSEIDLKKISDKIPDADHSFGDGWKMILKIVAAIVIVGTIIFILYSVFKQQGFDRSLTAVDLNASAEDTEQRMDEVHEDELTTLLKQALDTNEHRLAMRFQFLILLKLLMTLERIDWKKNKTNGDYIRETRKYHWNPQFTSTTNYYEGFWYAQKECTADHVGFYIQETNQLIATLKAQKFNG